jgi:acetoin utilization deacetylase AcuC-like enzyme
VHLYQTTQSQVIEREEYDDEDSEQLAPRGRSVFYPGTGSEIENTQVNNTGIYPGGILNVPMTPGQATATNWRKEFTERIFPRLIDFQPDLIFVSAGFDAHEED